MQVYIFGFLAVLAYYVNAVPLNDGKSFPDFSGGLEYKLEDDSPISRQPNVPLSVEKLAEPLSSSEKKPFPDFSGGLEYNLNVESLISEEQTAPLSVEKPEMSSGENQNVDGLENSEAINEKSQTNAPNNQPENTEKASQPPVSQLSKPEKYRATEKSKLKSLSLNEKNKEKNKDFKLGLESAAAKFKQTLRQQEEDFLIKRDEFIQKLEAERNKFENMALDKANEFVGHFKKQQEKNELIGQKIKEVLKLSFS